MSLPVLTSSYRIDPDEDVEKAWIKIEGLRQAFCGGPLIPRTDDQWIYGGPWLDEVRHGTETAPPGLLSALDALPDILRSEEPGWEIIESLSSMAVFGIDWSTGEYQRMYISAAGFAYLALVDILPVRHAEWLELAAVVYGDLNKATEGEPEEWVEQVLKLQSGAEGRGVRDGLVLLMRRLGRVVRRVNTPQAYKLLLAYLQHPWPEVREAGARCLMQWEGPELVELIRKALLAGEEDPAASEHSQNLIRKLSRYGADAALPTLEGLRRTKLDGPALQKAIRSLSRGAGDRIPRATTHIKPIFEPDERVLMGALVTTGERVGIAVQPLHSSAFRAPGSPEATATRASVRRSQHPAHVGHVNIVLHGRGESIENTERLAVGLAAAIWGVEITPTPDAVVKMPNFNELEAEIPMAKANSEPSLLVQRESASLWLVKQRDHRPYHQGLGVELALQEGDRTTGSLRVYARWPDDPDQLLRATLRGAQHIWSEWLQPVQTTQETPPQVSEGAGNEPGPMC